MNNINLYPFCDKWFEKNGSIWIYSDPHFNDKESAQFRTELGYYISDEEQVKRINAKVGKNDTLIILGDIGDISYVSKLKAGYKVLIQGNHDKGKTYYQREVTEEFSNENMDDADKATLALAGWAGAQPAIHQVIRKYTKVNDNRLFDEVYDGKLQISKNIVLSHEPVDDKYCFNIHGHCHPSDEPKPYPNLKDYLTSGGLKIENLTAKELFDYQIKLIKSLDLKSFNSCAELIGYEPIPLKKIINSGVLKDIIDMHREVIDSKEE